MLPLARSTGGNKVEVCGPLAQVVEHLTFNQVVPRSSRGWLTIWPVGQAVKTSPFHGGDMGSIPVRVTKSAT